jgi:hypothetical protein
MKKATILALATIAIFVASCGNGATTSTTSTDSTAVDSTSIDSTAVSADSTTAKIPTDSPSTYHTPIN